MKKKQTSSQVKLKHALINLLLKKNYNKITVSDLINEAHISRSTFYQYYDDKEDLCNSVKIFETEYFVSLVSVENLVSKEGLVEILQTVLQEKRHLYAASQMPTFNTNIRSVIENALLKNQEYRYNLTQNTALDFKTAQFAYVTVITELIISWIKSDCTEDIASLATKIFKLSALFFGKLNG